MSASTYVQSPGDEPVSAGAEPVVSASTVVSSSLKVSFVLIQLAAHSDAGSEYATCRFRPPLDVARDHHTPSRSRKRAGSGKSRG